MFDYPYNALARLPALVCALLLAFPVSADKQAAADAMAAYDQAMDSGLYEEAQAAAKLVLNDAIRKGRRDDLSTASLLSDLALAQRKGGDHAAALQNYEQAISIVELNTDMLNPALAELLLGVGATHMLEDRPDLALQPLERALHVHAVNDGPHNLEQSAALELLTDAYVAMGEYGEAEDVADRLVILYGRHFTKQSGRVVPYLLRKGKVLRTSGSWREERSAYHDALEIAKRTDSDDHKELVDTYIHLGESFQTEYYTKYLQAERAEELPDERFLSEAESSFEKAVAAARPDGGGEGWRSTSRALLALGDFYTLARENGRARLQYRAAWELLTQSTEGLELRRQQLEQVVPLLRPPADLSVTLPEEADGAISSTDLLSGYIEVQFTVTRRGRLTDIGLVEIHPGRNDAVETEIKKVLNQSVFRPRFENGFAVDTYGVTLKFEFPYPEQMPDSRPAPENRE